jgi:ribonuclease P protein component
MAAVARLRTLKRRSEFLRVRGGRRYASPVLVLEARLRVRPEPPEALGPAVREEPAGARFGITITKALGKSVVRNRIRRRIKAILAGLSARGTCPDGGPGTDYVIVARDRLVGLTYDELRGELEKAFAHVHRSNQHPAAKKRTIDRPVTR